MPMSNGRSLYLKKIEYTPLRYRVRTMTMAKIVRARLESR